LLKAIRIGLINPDMRRNGIPMSVRRYFPSYLIMELANINKTPKRVKESPIQGILKAYPVQMKVPGLSPV